MIQETRNMDEKSDDNYFCGANLKLELQQRVVKEQYCSNRSNLSSPIYSPAEINLPYSVFHHQKQAGNKCGHHITKQL